MYVKLFDQQKKKKKRTYIFISIYTKLTPFAPLPTDWSRDAPDYTRIVIEKICIDFCGN